MEDSTEKFKTIKEGFFDTFVNQNIALGIELSLLDIQHTGKLTQLFYLINIYRKTELELDVTNKEIYLNFDITHTENDYQVLGGFIEKIEDKNVVIAINDFGTGYLNICDLRSNNPSFIKIDETLLQGYCENQNIQLKTQQILEITKKMNIDILVEYHKNIEQLKLLHGLGINIFKKLNFDKLCY